MASKALAALIEEATHKNKSQLDPQYYKTLKQHLRHSEEAVAQAFEVLYHRLEAKHAQTRLLALHLVNELFKRSRTFRALLLQRLGTFLELTVGHNPSKPLPGPAEPARALREKVLTYLQSWKEELGEGHPQLAVALKYLKDVLRLRLPEISTPGSRQEAEEEERQRRVQQHLRTRYDQLVGEVADQLAAARNLLTQMDECFLLLDGEGAQQEPPQAGDGPTPGGTPGDRQAAGDDDGMEWEDARASATRGMSQWDIDALFEEGEEEEEQEGLALYAPDSMEETADVTSMDEVHEEGDQARTEREAKDEAVMTTLRDVCRQVVGQVAPWVSRALQVLVQLQLPPGDPLTSQRQQHLREVVLVNARLHRAKERALQHGIEMRGKPKPPAATPPAGGQGSAGGTGEPPPAMTEGLERGASTSGPSAVDAMLPLVKLPSEVRERLLQSAPLLPSGYHKVPSLPESWSLANPSGFEHYNHWGAVDNTAERPSEQLQALLGYSASYYEPAAAPPGLAPGTSGAPLARKGSATAAGGGGGSGGEQQAPPAPLPTLEQHISMLTTQRQASSEQPRTTPGEAEGLMMSQGPDPPERAASGPGPHAAGDPAGSLGPADAPEGGSGGASASASASVRPTPSSAGPSHGPSGAPAGGSGGARARPKPPSVPGLAGLMGPIGSLSGGEPQDRQQRRRQEREYNMRVLAAAGDEGMARQLQEEEERQREREAGQRKKTKKKAMTAGQKLLSKLAQGR